MKVKCIGKRVMIPTLGIDMKLGEEKEFNDEIAKSLISQKRFVEVKEKKGGK